MTPSENSQQSPTIDAPPPATGTATNIGLAAIMGLGLTLIFFLLLRIPGIYGSYVFNVFCRRGPVQHITMVIFFWGVAMLALKIKLIRLEMAIFEKTLLPTDPGVLIRQEDALQHIRKIKRLSAADRARQLTNRVWRALVRFKLLGSADKVDDILRYQGEMDAANMESSYSLIKFLVGLVPILGFLGTVLGISDAVSGFGRVIAAAGSIEEVKGALEKVTLGLGTAFDTTLVALVMSAILMLGLTLFQRAEDKLLSRIEDYCMENLLERLWVPPVDQQFEAAMVRALSSLPKELAKELRAHTEGR
jgi:biopolymer transport protein ExbB/TolQ